MAIRSKRSAFLGIALVSMCSAGALDAQALAAAPAVAQERGPQALSLKAIQSSIDALGSVGAAFAARMNAARALRRAQAEAVAPALIHAVESHSDQYVRFRALVLLTAFNDSRPAGVVRDIVGNPNDRLRAAAYMYYEHHPLADMVPILLQALDREDSEFVRPALVRALAAQGGDLRVRDTLLQEIGRGQDYFRSAVIEALGDYRAMYAVEPLLQIARLGGLLQIDAVVALGKLRDQRAMETLEALQRVA